MTVSSSIAHPLDYAPDALGGRRHFDVADAERGERVDERVGDRGQGADITGLVHQRIAPIYEPALVVLTVLFIER